MTETLRDRIAAVLMRDVFGLTTQTTALRQADAVIAELKLHPVESLDRRFIRWVTAWRNNPELGGEHDE